MPVTVVHGLEVIHVDDEQGQGLVAGDAPAFDVRQGLLEAAPVRQAGQRIGEGEAGQLPLHPSPVPELASEQQREAGTEPAQDQHDAADHQGLGPPLGVDLVRRQGHGQDQGKIADPREGVVARLVAAHGASR